MNKFTDDRGTIKDLLVTDDLSVTEITFTEGAVRGNHEHKFTTQIDKIVEGKLLMKTDKWEGEVYTLDMITHEPGTPHAYKALVPSRMISICFGVRRGEEYEKDVIRLEKPLL